MATTRRDRKRINESRQRRCTHEWKTKASWPLTVGSSVTVLLEECKECGTQRHARREGVET